MRAEPRWASSAWRYACSEEHEAVNRLQRLEKAFEGVEWVLLLAINSLGLGMSTSAGSTQGVNTVVTKIGTSHPPCSQLQL